MASLDWWDYHGESLCPRCGVGAESKNQYKVCPEYRDVVYTVSWIDPESGDKLYFDDFSPHTMACERYNYGDLCAECEKG